MGLLIQHGTVVTADKTLQADILIEGETIQEIRSGIPPAPAHKTLDAAEMLLLPGGIDAHTHLDMPFGGTTSSDDFETGTRAAVIGGTTSIVDFAIQGRGTHMRDALDTWTKKAQGKACIDYGLHMIVTDLGGAGLDDMDEMVREGVASFKLFMAYPNVLMVDDATIFKALKQTSRNGALICMHAENGSVIDVIVQQALADGKTAPVYHALTRPTIAEAEAVNRAIALAKSPTLPSISSTSLLKTPSIRSAKRAAAAFPPLPRPARNTSCFPSTNSNAPASKAPSTSSRRRYAKRKIFPNSGMA